MSSPDGTSMMSPQLRWQLLGVLRFHDAFTHEIVRNSLQVTIPNLGLLGVAGSDATYRFVSSQEQPPAGTFPVHADVPDAEYIQWDPFWLTFASLPPILPLRDHFLVEAPLWPTRRLAPRAGETSLVIQIQRSKKGDPVSDLRVKLIRAGAIPSLDTRTNLRGECFFRVPSLLPSVGDSPTSELIEVEIRSANGILLTVPGTISTTLSNGISNFQSLVIYP